MPSDSDHFADRIHQSVHTFTEDEYDVLRCRLSDECNAIFSDREFIQKLNSVFPE